MMKKLCGVCLVVLMLIMFLGVFNNVASATPVQWHTQDGGNGHLYDVILVGSALSWDDARTGAQAIGTGWDLATVTSSEEDSFIRSLFSSDPSFFNSVPSGTNRSGPWIGGFNVVSSSNFQWVTGEPVTFTNWGPSEPYGNGQTISYTDFTSPFGDGSGIAWNDIGPGLRSDGPIAYVAEVVPEPSVIEAVVDIKPRSCPNPLNVKSKGVLPVAILGTEEFDASNIDPAAVRLQGVAPLRSSLEDVATPVADGPIAYWTFDDSCDPGHDDSGNEHNGTPYGATSVEGICQNALQFDGQDDYVQVPHDPSFDLTDQITIATWVKRGNIEDRSPIISKGADMPGGTINYELFIESDGTLSFGFWVLGWHVAYSDSKIADTQWHHVALTYDRAQICLYIDGSPDSTTPDTTAMTSNVEPIGIGIKFSSWPFHYLEGKLDEVGIYNRALSASEISELADTSCLDKTCECTTEGPDGYTDLTVKFDTQQVLAAIGGVNSGDVLQLDLTGLLNDGTPIEGTDCMVVVGNFKAFKKGDINKDGITNIVDFTLMAETWLESTIIQEE